MKPWNWALIGFAVGFPVAFLFFAVTAVGAAWGDVDLSVGLAAWLAGFAAAGAAAFGLKNARPWGSPATWIAVALMVLGTVFAIAKTGRPQPLLFALPVPFLLAAAWFSRTPAPEAPAT